MVSLRTRTRVGIRPLAVCGDRRSASDWVRAFADRDLNVGGHDHEIVSARAAYAHCTRVTGHSILLEGPDSQGTAVCRTGRRYPVLSGRRRAWVKEPEFGSSILPIMPHAYVCQPSHAATEIVGRVRGHRVLCREESMEQS